MASILEAHQIHTIISCLMLMEESIATSEAAAIAAAEMSRCTRRFIASNWGPPTKEEYRSRSPWFPFQLDIRDQLRTTSLEWTEIVTGYFLDYWGMPHLKTNMTPDMPVLDIVDGVAGIPGTGNELISFAYTYDVARVITELLMMPKWDEATYIVADKLSWNEFIALAERACGRKFDVAYDYVSKLAKGDITELPNHRQVYHEFPKQELRQMYSSLGLSMAMGTFDLDLGRSIHLQLPHIRMMTVRDMLQDIWASRHTSAS
ncbi:uncharacterized protein F5Z01DRAFT_259395 [Emericellopsis atlantica]|uniref:NmrA-like domain-containing protein n=1 Tax=Emericellopsis atlantica TaxID=2614577 RepID=A0A9P7ZH33_9HYPO|nr:uncharacterized protein F5Z01DRAFT_259395 [Emericellopsis atlantica]KAG9251964.1 hypothetical protein F5Z01DRAFT_259395 [Emericellopsis atlantica]